VGCGILAAHCEASERANEEERPYLRLLIHSDLETCSGGVSEASSVLSPDASRRLKMDSRGA
jgi:hypothetical protein